MSSQEASLDNAPADQGQLLTTPESIFRLLRRLQDSRSPLTLSFSAVEGHYTSYVVQTNFKERYIILDEVKPDWGDRLMTRGTPFTFEAFHDGCRMESSEIKALARGNRDGDTIYKVSFPDSIDYLQRRRFFRASVRQSLEIEMHLKGDNEVYQGLLRDLSAQGCQIELAGDWRAFLLPDTQFDQCDIIFPNGQVINISLEVKHVAYNDKQKISSIGCQFTKLTAMHDRKISFVVAELQRDNARFSSSNAIATGLSALFTPKEDEETQQKEAEAAAKAEKQARKARFEQLTEEMAQVDIQQTHEHAVNAVKSLVARLKAKQPLPIQEAWQASQALRQAWKQDRQQLLLLTRIRSPENYLYEHSVSVGLLLADQLSTPEKTEEAERLIFSGLCHDLGKGLIPERILGKAGKLTANEAKVMHKHALVTRELLSRQQDMPEEALLICTQNCERLDGSGHPEGLQGKQISTLGRMAAVIDVFDAMTNARSYRGSLVPALAYKRLLQAKEHFDPRLTQRLIKRQGLFPIGSMVRLSGGYLAFVKRLDAQQKPEILRLVYNVKELLPTPAEDLRVDEMSAEYGTIEGPDSPGRYHLSNHVLLGQS